jgi:hypothetical protein
LAFENRSLRQLFGQIGIIFSTKILVYADCIKLWINNADEFEENLYQLINVGNKFVLKINLGKTAIKQISRNPDDSCMNLNGIQVQEVDIFSYQGCVVTINDKIQNEINEWIKNTFFHLVTGLFRHKYMDEKCNSF